MATEQFNHAARHKELHTALDELVADYIGHTKKRLSETTLLEFMEWSATQLETPSEKKRGNHESSDNQQ